MGPLSLPDLIGLDVVLDIMETLYSGDPKPSPLLLWGFNIGGRFFWASPSHAGVLREAQQSSRTIKDQRRSTRMTPFGNADRLSARHLSRP